MRRWTLLVLLVGTSLFLGACPQPPPMNTPMKPANTASARVRPRVLVEPILSTTALFPEELALVQADVERFIAGQTLAPVDLVAPAEVTALAALARSGRTREGGAVCALPPSLPRLLRARYPGAFAANVALSCGKTDCALELGLRAGYTQLGTWGSSPIERLGTGPKSAVMLDAWRTAARELMSPPPIVSPAADTPESILVANNERDVVTLDHVQPVGAWKVPMPSLATFAPQQAAFAACGVPAR